MQRPTLAASRNNISTQPNALGVAAWNSEMAMPHTRTRQASLTGHLMKRLTCVIGRKPTLSIRLPNLATPHCV